MSQLKTYFYLILLFFETISLAQQPTFENITTSNGLSQNNVHTILKDHNGYLWFGTDDGLNKYDGYEFEVFQRDLSTKNGLSTNLILSLKQDSEHNIWIGTADKGIIIYDYEKEKFKPFLPDNCSSDIFNSTRVIDIAFLPNKDIIIVTPYDIYIFSKKEDKYHLVKQNQKNSLTIWDGVFRDLYFINNKIFISSIKGLYTLTPKGNSNYSLDRNILFGKQHIKNIFEFGSNFIIHTNNRLLFWDGAENKYRLSEKVFYHTLEDNNNMLWGITKGNIYHFEFVKTDTEKIQIKDDMLSNFSAKKKALLNSSFIFCSYADNTGNLWFGTRDQGVIKVNPKGKNFNQITPPFSSRINTIFEDSDANIWIGTSKNRAFLYNETTTEKFQKIDLGLNKTRNILSFQEIEHNNEKYIVTGTHFKSNHLKHKLLENKKTENSLISKKLDSIVFPVFAISTKNNEMWMGTYEQGIMRYDLQKDTLITYLPFNSNLPSKIVRNLFFDSKERLWIGTDKGLCLLDSKQLKSKKPIFKIFKHQENDSTTLSHDYVIPIAETKDHEIWVGTLGGGLNKFNEETQNFSQITTLNGLPNNNIKAILEDDNNNLWVSSNRGLSKINLSNYDITNFTIEDGLQDYEFSELSGFKLKDGRLAFGGIHGLNIFDPEQIKTDNSTPKLVFENLQVLNQEITPEQKFNNRILLEKNLNETSQIQLKHQENSFVIGFTALSYDSPKKIQYQYKLEGFDKEWIKTDWKSRFAKYTSLKSGTYTFLLKASNSSRTQNTKPISIKVIVQRPFWFSNTALLCYLLLLSAIVFLCYRYIQIRKKSKEAILKAEIEKESTKELTQLKLKFFTNISHELRTPLAIINGYIDQLSKKWSSNINPTNDFEAIKRNTNILLRLVNQLLDFRKFEQGKLSLNTSKANIIEFVTEVYHSFEILAKKKSITFFITHDLVENHLVFDFDKMDKILNNILSNAFRHTQKNGTISINLTDNEKYTTIAITDNGKGIAKDKQKIIFDRFYVAENFEEFNVQNTGIGLSFTKSLVEMHEGKITLESEVNQGTSFFLRFKKNLPINNPEGHLNKEKYSFLDNSIGTTLNTNPSFETLNETNKILIVEDNDDLLSYLFESFKKNYVVYTAKNGKEGLELCAKHYPDLVISDVMMPVMNGFQLCHAIKQHENLCHIPVILLTAKFTDTSEIEGFNEGADAYVTKPFNLEVLEARVRAIISSRQRIWEQFKANPFTANLEGNFTTSDQKFIKKVVTMIQENLSDTSFSSEQLANSFNMSQPTFIKKMKSLVGETPNKYIRSLKMNKAAELLLQTDLNVSEIIYKVGFTDLKYFREQFKKTFNTTPSGYRKNQSVTNR